MKNSKSESYAQAGVDITAGYRAVELLNKGIGNRVITFVDNKLGDKNLRRAVSLLSANDS